MALGAAGGGIIIYNVVADRTEDLAISDDVVEDFTSTKKDKIDDLVNPAVPELGDANNPNDPNRARPEDEDNRGLVVPNEEENEVTPINTDQAPTVPGQGEGGQTGDGETRRILPQIIGPVATEFKQISAHTHHSCAIRGTERRVWCWGNNSNGELGNGEIRGSVETNFVSPVAVQATELEKTNVQSVAVGHQFSCALLANKAIQCWGSNSNGQLGIGSAGGSTITPVTVVGINNATSIVAGSRHTCALLEDKTARCWGLNLHGQLGNGVLGGADEAFPTPETVGGATPLTNIESIATSDDHTCALLTDKTARCWGANSYGGLGNGIRNTKAPPNIVTVLESVGGEALGDIKQISVGSDHTCALLEDKTAQCWGLNSHGQLGTGNTDTSFSPLPVMDVETAAPLANIVQISARANHTCALLEDKTAQCWGFNNASQLGTGADLLFLSDPLPVVESLDGGRQFQPLANIVSIIPGGNHTCALLEDETARCWGLQEYGAVGDGWQRERTAAHVVPVTEAPPEPPPETPDDES